MNTWEPATLEEVKGLLAEGLDALHPIHRARFETMRVPLRQTPVTSMPGEYVYVVAEYEGKVLYYSDVEDGWELETPNAAGGITERGCNQYELSHLMHQLFGSPDARAKPSAI